MAEISGRHPEHLDSSKLGTREYWDNYYQNDLDQRDADEDDEPVDPSELESWFDDVDAPARVFEYLTSEDFPLSPNSASHDESNDRTTGCSVLDLGTGNGSMLFSLRMEGGFEGSMLGLDYSQQSVDLARRLSKQYGLTADDEDNNVQRDTKKGNSANPIRFEKIDLIRDDPTSADWWLSSSGGRGGFDLVLDKGTFDAISLSSETINDGTHGAVRICELYPRKTVELVVAGGYLLVTSCNWTEEELTRWFLHGAGVEGQLEVFGKVQYPVYEYGGQQGQGVASVCFRKKATT